MMNPKVDFYFLEAKTWQREIQELRKIVLTCGLTEQLKWGVPCYTFQDNNILLIHTFKDYCAVLFFKGALLRDTRGVLVQQTKNTQSARQIRYTSLDQITDNQSIFKAFIQEALNIEKAGTTVPLKSTAEFPMPAEFQSLLSGKKGQTLKAAFESLTPGRQRGYLLYFAQPKQSSTRVSRIEKCIPLILTGKGLND